MHTDRQEAKPDDQNNSETAENPGDLPVFGIVRPTKSFGEIPPVQVLNRNTLVHDAEGTGHLWMWHLLDRQRELLYRSIEFVVATRMRYPTYSQLPLDKIGGAIRR